MGHLSQIEIRRPAAGSGDPAGARCNSCPYFLRRYDTILYSIEVSHESFNDSKYRQLCSPCNW